MAFFYILAALIMKIIILIQILSSLDLVIILNKDDNIHKTLVDLECQKFKATS